MRGEICLVDNTGIDLQSNREISLKVRILKMSIFRGVMDQGELAGAGGGSVLSNQDLRAVLTLAPLYFILYNVLRFFILIERVSFQMSLIQNSVFPNEGISDFLSTAINSKKIASRMPSDVILQDPLIDIISAFSFCRVL